MYKLACLFAGVSGNSLLQSPRGSNNRLTEKYDIVTNDRRLFRSNNNFEGGYNVGEKTENAARKQDDFYEMKYFQSGNAGKSELTIEWIQSMGCGVDELGQRQHGCKILLQSMCQDADLIDETKPMEESLDNKVVLRNGWDQEIQEFTMQKHDYPDPAGGCFGDRNRWRDLPHLAFKKIKDYSVKSIVEHCKDTCAEKGYIYAGVQLTRQCFCGNSFGKHHQLPKEACDFPCRDQDHKETGEYHTNTCGGWFKQNIYLASPKPEKPEEEDQTAKNNRRDRSDQAKKGIHESWEYYDACPEKSVNAKRHGYECPHERENIKVDYSTPWVDIAVFLDEPTKENCAEMTEQNHRKMYQCIEKYDDGSRKHKSQYKDEKACKDNGHLWLHFHHSIGVMTEMNTEGLCNRANTRLGATSKVKYHWSRPLNYVDVANDILPDEQCLILPKKADCLKVPNTRPNYFGNVDGPSKSGEPMPQPPRYTWELPKFEDGKEKRCVFRLRTFIDNEEANFSHGKEEHTYWSESEDAEDERLLSLTLAVPNMETQNGKVVFEDRSHVFRLLPRPEEIPDDLKIHNIVVRGKRGNIVQTYPMTEYDFVPNRLNINEGEAVQVQWTGSNTHFNQNSGRGDGQVNAEGQGKGGSDRHNFLQLGSRKHNFPAPFEAHTLFHNAEWVWSSHPKGAEENKAINLSMSHATSGYYQCVNGENCNGQAYKAKKDIDDELDNASPSFQGHVFKPAKGEYFYKCMRNDNFSNRSQKGELIVL